jgi:hypothetical protein
VRFALGIEPQLQRLPLIARKADNGILNFNQSAHGSAKITPANPFGKWQFIQAMAELPRRRLQGKDRD